MGAWVIPTFPLEIQLYTDTCVVHLFVHLKRFLLYEAAKQLLSAINASYSVSNWCLHIG